MRYFATIHPTSSDNQTLLFWLGLLALIALIMALQPETRGMDEDED